MEIAPSGDFKRTQLGRTGVPVGRLGVAASYGVPADAVEWAFEQGVNYMFWGSRRSESFGTALKNLARYRDRLVLVVESYTRAANLLKWSLERALRTLGFDYADVLLLGLWNKGVPARILETACRLKEAGLTRFIAISTHQRKLVPLIAQGHEYDIVHFRHNAAHPGAEKDIFPNLPSGDRPGLVAFTATSWGTLLGKTSLQGFFSGAHRIPESERTPTATDCYRFVLSRPEVDVCLSGPANAAQMKEAVEALRLGPMSEDELAWMRRVGQAVRG